MAGAAVGLYPYLTSLNPGGVQAVSGFAYADAGATPLGSGASGAVTVGLNAGGSLVGTAATGANGYYYITTSPGTVTSGQSLLAYTAAGAPAAAALGVAAGGLAQSGPTLYGNALTVPTSAILWSAAPQSAAAARTVNSSALAAAAGSNTAAQTAIANATGLGLVASGTSFTIDQAINPTTTLELQTASAVPITVSQPITVQSGGSLGLLAGGLLAINAPISVRGGETVSLAAGSDTTTLPGTSLPGLSFGAGASLTFVNADGTAASAPVAGQALRLNGTAATLIYNMAELDAIDGVDATTGNSIAVYGPGLAGAYGLAGSLSAAGPTYTNALIGTNSSGSAATRLTGSFEGLGNTISNLTIATSGAYVGLFGYSAGTIADLKLTGAAISGDSDIGVIGKNDGTIVGLTSSGTVTGLGGNAYEIGGLTGANSGTIVHASTEGTVTAPSNSYELGGLIGLNHSGAVVTDVSSATAVTGSYHLGGLIGDNYAPLSHVTATGNVIGLAGSDEVGGPYRQKQWQHQRWPCNRQRQRHL